MMIKETCISICLQIIFVVITVRSASVETVDDEASATRIGGCKFEGVQYSDGEQPNTDADLCASCVCRGNNWHVINHIGNRTRCHGCHAYNDPHIKSGDGQPYNYHKPCEHAMLQRTKLPVATNKIGAPHTDFGIFSTFAPCPPNINPSKCLKSTIIKFNPGVTIVFNHRQPPGGIVGYKVTDWTSKIGPVAGTSFTLGASANIYSGSPNVGMGKDVLLFKVIHVHPGKPNVACIGVIAKHVFVVICPNSIWIWYRRNRNDVRGLCGNFNGQKPDDITTNMGNQLAVNQANINIFGHSWRTSKACGKELRNVKSEEVVPANEKNCQNFKDHHAACSKTINDNGGRLDDEHKDTLIDACVDDICLSVKYARSDIEIQRGIETWLQSAQETVIVANANV